MLNFLGTTTRSPVGDARGGGGGGGGAGSPHTSADTPHTTTAMHQDPMASVDALTASQDGGVLPHHPLSSAALPVSGFGPDGLHVLGPDGHPLPVNAVPLVVSGDRVYNGFPPGLDPAALPELTARMAHYHQNSEGLQQQSLRVVAHDSGYEEDEEDDDEDGSRSQTETTSHTSSGSASASASGSSSSSSDEDEDNEGKDSAKRYPMFTSEYASYCSYGMVPFLREEVVRVAAGGVSSPVGSSSSPLHGSPGPQPSVRHQFILYGEYLYEATLGKGTYSKVVLATPLRAHGAGGPHRQGSPGSSSSNSSTAAPVPTVSTPVVTSGNGRHFAGNEVRVALKIFRNKETYREACWDEMVILSLLCGLPAVPTMSLGGRSGAGSLGGGLAEYTASLARFVAPLSYIPHPMHPALVLPLLGPSTLRVSRKVKQASRDVAESEGYDIRKSPQGKPAVWYRGLPLPLLKSVIYQILIFLQYSHSKGIVHTDLKPENVLFESVHSKPANVAVFYQELLQKTGQDNEEEEAAKEQERESGTGETSPHPSSRKTHAEDTDEAPDKIRLKKQSNDEQRFQAEQQQGAGRRRPSITSAGGSSFQTSPIVAGAPGMAATGGASNFPFFSFNGGANEKDHPSSRVRFAHNVVVDIPHLPSIRVVDLGAAQLLSSLTHISRIDRQTPVSYDRIQTKHYISPEVLLCTGWSASADLFSLGCMIPELLTGDCLFMPQHRVEHLALMEHIIGPFAEEDVSQYASHCHGRRHGSPADGSAPTGRPQRFIDDAFVCNPQNAEIDFDTRTKQLRWPLSKKMVQQRAILVTQYEHGYHNSDANSEDDEVEPSTIEDIQFVKQKATLKEILGPIPLLLDLTEKMLVYHPLERISPADALRHPFFQTM